MSTTLYVTKMRPEKYDWALKLPLKRLLAGRYGRGDGSCGGRAIMSPSADEIMWLEGAEATLRESGGNQNIEAAAELYGMIEALRAGYALELDWR